MASVKTPDSFTERLEPKLITTLREGYSLAQFGRDLIAGVVVGIVALPLAIALGIASGVTPERGLYTAIVAGFIISALGGSRVQIGGPTGAFIVIVYGIVEKHGYEGLAVATVLAGALLVVMGLARLGTVIKFVPYPVTVGFTSGIALIIAVSQLRDFLGLAMEKVPADFVDKLAAYAKSIGTVNFYAVGVGLFTTLTVLYWPRLTRRIPGSLVAILAATAAVHLFGLPVETIGDRFGSVPTSLPSAALPALDWTHMRELFPAAIAIALLAGIESLLSAVVADGMLGTRHRSNTELIAQGIANIASPIFGGIPATGAIARTATNIKNGGRTPVAGIIHAVTLLVIMLFLADWATLIPLATLSGILIAVAYNMSEWRLFAHLFRSPQSDVIVLLATFFLTVLVDLTVAIEVGMVLAAFLFMRRVALLSDSRWMRDMLADDEDNDDAGAISSRAIPDGIEVFQVQGALFFGAASKFKDALRRVEKPPRILILRMRNVFAIDATGLRALEDLCDKATRDGTVVLFSGVRAQPLLAIERAGILERIGRDNALSNLDAALERARWLLGTRPASPAPPQGGVEAPQEAVLVGSSPVEGK